MANRSTNDAYTPERATVSIPGRGGLAGRTLALQRVPEVVELLAVVRSKRVGAVVFQACQLVPVAGGPVEGVHARIHLVEIERV
jgi:hypothetical protein